MSGELPFVDACDAAAGIDTAFGCRRAWRPIRLPISTFHASENEMASAMVMAISGSSPVEHPALQMRSERRFFQNFLM
jgi:hypothetical protein